jgi:hypothetical protein
MDFPVPFNKKRLVDLCHKTSHLHHGISTTLGMKGDEYVWLLGVFFWMRKPAKSPPLAKLVAFQAFSDVRKQSARHLRIHGCLIPAGIHDLL